MVHTCGAVAIGQLFRPVECAERRVKTTHVGALDEEQIDYQSNVADNLTAQPQSAERRKGGQHPVWELLNELAHCRSC